MYRVPSPERSYDRCSSLSNNDGELRTDGGQTSKKEPQTSKKEPRQIGPRLDPDLADDFEKIIRHRHNGKYKGRLSDEVENAIKLSIGKIITENPTWVDDATDDDQRERFNSYAKHFQQSCGSAGIESQVTEELTELRQEIEAVNATNTNMLSQILSQVNDQGSSDS